MSQADTPPAELAPPTSVLGRIRAWPWWRGWRGWLLFAAIFAVAAVVSWVLLARAFAPAPVPWSQYPGVSGVPADEVLANRSTEDVQRQVDEVMVEIREIVTDEFGLEWVDVREPEQRPEPNRYGGTSLLSTYESAVWQTRGTLRTMDDKQRMVDIVTEVMRRHAISDPRLLNGVGPDSMQQFGGFTLETQGRWVLSGTPAGVSRGSLDLTILDLSVDRTGTLAAQSAEDSEDHGYLPEYVSVAFTGRYLLSESDREEFARRAALYEGHIAPVPGRAAY